MSKFEIAQIVVWLVGSLLQGGAFGFFFGRQTEKTNGLDVRVTRLEAISDQELLTKAQSAGR